MGSEAADERRFLYLAGYPIDSSVSPATHTFIANIIGEPWTCELLEVYTIQEVVEMFRRPTFAGGVVTMPYKKAIIPFLDSIDDIVIKLGACNNVRVSKEDGKLHGTNTDWVGIRESLLVGSDAGRGRQAMVFGAGGASRAALYALYAELHCDTIYIVNRDEDEVAQLLHDTQAYEENKRPNLVHVRSAEEARSLPTPFYIVSTVPDFEAVTSGEVAARGVLTEFLSRKTKGVLLDMCYHPRRTRILKLAEQAGWTTIEGIEATGFQLELQWNLWSPDKKVPMDKAWKKLREVTDNMAALN
ncbi:Shikimate [Trichoderma simmonsii]|uniref:Shikimate n=1 Tax=Trichoderma simmonsii TaxID=1491479 RepID=A0A8G0LBS6_9HYPO|nr:Shikimate [Trichoderma simmonsii]